MGILNPLILQTTCIYRKNKFVILFKNIHSIETEVVGATKYVLAILDMTGNLASLCIQFDFKLVNCRMTYAYFTDYSNNKKKFWTSMVSKIIRIIDYSLTSLIINDDIEKSTIRIRFYNIQFICFTQYQFNGPWSIWTNIYICTRILQVRVTKVSSTKYSKYTNDLNSGTTNSIYNIWNIHC
jgi:hypothetical protein